jgi:lycopene beta-cyclase
LRPSASPRAPSAGLRYQLVGPAQRSSGPVVLSPYYGKELGARVIRPADNPRYDVLLVGGGLANSLIALDLKRARPELRVAVLDAAAEPSPHTWCLFESDLDGGWSDLPLTADYLWDGYEVRFPAHDRQLTTSYGCLTSHSLRRRLRDVLGPDLRIGVAQSVEHAAVVCEHGERLEAGVVIDGRGAQPSTALELGWQKFVGLELTLKRPHGLTRPIIMDADVHQLDGYRFVYVLPLAPDRLLIEDTRYSDGAQLDRQSLEAEVLRYARRQGWLIRDITRREEGVLPVVIDGDIHRFWRDKAGQPPQTGMAGAFFHPTTGYSLPDAVRVSRLVVSRIDDGPEALAQALEQASIGLWRARSFYRVLNRMLFRAAEPSQRYCVLERFYRLPQPLVERFYAGRIRLADKARILAGKPPVPVWRAVKALTEPRRHLVDA